MHVCVRADIYICIMYRVYLHTASPRYVQEPRNSYMSWPQFMKDATTRTSSSPDRAKQNLCLIAGFQLGTSGTQSATRWQRNTSTRKSVSLPWYADYLSPSVMDWEDYYYAFSSYYRYSGPPHTSQEATSLGTFGWWLLDISSSAPRSHHCSGYPVRIHERLVFLESR